MRYVVDARFVRRRPSGIGNYVRALIDRMPALAPTEPFRVWTHPEVPTPCTANNVVHHLVPQPADGAATLLAPATLDELTPDDVVHFPHSILGRGLRCASVVTIHDLMWLEQPSLVDARPLVRRLRQRFYRAGMQWALRHATRIITVSRATADRVLEHAPNAGRRMVVTYNAVADAYCPAPDAEASRRRAVEIVGVDAPYLLVVGKNEPYKQHEVAVEAFASVARQDERLVLVQRHNQGRGLARLVRKRGVRHRTIWLPTLAEDDLIDVMRHATALVQPSAVEGFGIPVLEAMACGCPVIASDTPALVEVLGGAALHAEVGNVVDFARAMRRIRDGTVRSELRARGLERARDFSWDETARATLDVYRAARSEWA